MLKWSVACINAFSLSVGLWHSHWVANMEKTRILWFIIRIIILQIWAGITQLHKCEGAGREIHTMAFNSRHWSLFCGDHPCFCATVGWEVDLRWEESHLGGLKVPLVSVAQHMGHRTWHQENQGYAQAPELAEDLRYSTPLCWSTLTSLGRCFEISQCIKLLAKSHFYVVSCVPQMHGPPVYGSGGKTVNENSHIVNQRGHKCLDVPITRWSKKFACAHPYLWFILRSHTHISFFSPQGAPLHMVFLLPQGVKQMLGCKYEF